MFLSARTVTCHGQKVLPGCQWTITISVKLKSRRPDRLPLTFATGQTSYITSQEFKSRESLTEGSKAENHRQRHVGGRTIVVRPVSTAFIASNPSCALMPLVHSRRRPCHWCWADGVNKGGGMDRHARYGAWRRFRWGLLLLSACCPARTALTMAFSQRNCCHHQSLASPVKSPPGAFHGSGPLMEPDFTSGSRQEELDCGRGIMEGFHAIGWSS